MSFTSRHVTKICLFENLANTAIYVYIYQNTKLKHIYVYIYIYIAKSIILNLY